jgi:hypothetical protein
MGFDISTPNGLDQINKVGGTIRELKAALEDSLSEEHYFPEGYHKLNVDSSDLPSTLKIGRWRYNPVTQSMQRDTGTTWEDLTTPSDLFPAGVKTVFCQSAAPTGWTRLTTWNDKMLRVVKTAGGGSGGTWLPTLQSTITAHTHNLSAYSGSVTHTLTTQKGDAGNALPRLIHNYVSDHDLSHTHDSVASNNFAHSHSLATSWRPAYNDVIVCQKD